MSCGELAGVRKNPMTFVFCPSAGAVAFCTPLGDDVPAHKLKARGMVSCEYVSTKKLQTYTVVCPANVPVLNIISLRANVNAKPETML